MFEPRLFISIPTRAAARRLTQIGVRPTWIASAGGAACLAAMLLIARDHYWAGLGFILLNRLLGGLVEAVGRIAGTSERGPYLKTLFDALFFASVPFAFALAGPERAVAATFLLFGLGVLGAASQGVPETQGGPGKGIVVALVVTTGYAFACVLPGWFSIAAYVLGLAAFILAGARVASAVNTLS